MRSRATTDYRQTLKYRKSTPRVPKIDTRRYSARMVDDAQRMVEALKALLREQGITYGELATRVGLSESSIKRHFSRGTFSLQRLAQCCDAVGASLFDLARRAKADAASEVYRLSLAQERRLVADVGLFYFFWMLVHRHSVKSIQRRYPIPARRLHRWLLELHRMEILELRDADRVVMRVPSTVVWNEDGPIERLIVARSLPVFLQGRFARDDEYFRFIVGKLSPESIAKFRAGLLRLAEQVFEQSVGTDALRSDSRTTALVVAFGRADFSLRDVVAAGNASR